MNDSNKSLVQVQEAMVAEISPLLATSTELYESALGQEVTDQQTMAAAVSIKKRITAHRTMVSQTRLGITRQFDEVKKAIMAKEAEVLEPLDKAQDQIGGKILAYEEQQERQRAEEQARIDGLVQSVSMGDLYALTTVDQVNSRGAEIKATYAKLPAADQNNAEVKLAFTQAINRLTDRKEQLVAAATEAKEKDAEQEKAAEQARQDRERQEQEAVQAAADERATKARTEKNQVKAGVRTVTEFEIVNAALVPWAFCSPDMVKIRAAANVYTGTEPFSVPGVKITTSKRV